MYHTYSCVIHGLDKKDFVSLKRLTKFSSKIYNAGLYNINQNFQQYNTYLAYSDNDKLLKSNINYKMLQANCTQQILKRLEAAFESYFKLLDKKKSENYEKVVKPPNYNKLKSYPIIIAGLYVKRQVKNIKNGYFRIPLSKEYEKKFGKTNIYIKWPKINGLDLNDLKEVQIFWTGCCFKANFVLIQHKQLVNLNSNDCLAIDFGVNNLATCVSTVGTPFIIDGRGVKSINQGWNKRKAWLQSKLPNGQHDSKQIRRITQNRNNCINDYIKKTAKIIIDFCLQNQIGNIILGSNVKFKVKSKLGKVNNQNFQTLPICKLRDQIVFNCKKYGINCIIQEESYTSKASFLDNDNIPTYDSKCSKKYNFSGKRIRRGLYSSSNKIIINADVNGAANIVRKCMQNGQLNNINLIKLSRGVSFYAQAD